jgi:hypothetical protein
MPFYKMNESGEAEQVSYEDWKEWCGCVDMSKLTLARHSIIETKQLGALAVDALKGCAKGKILATIETRMLTNTTRDGEPPWETTLLQGEGREWLGSTWERDAARGAHVGLVNVVTQRMGGRVLIR